MNYKGRFGAYESSNKLGPCNVYNNMRVRGIQSCNLARGCVVGEYGASHMLGNVHYIVKVFTSRE